MKASVSEKGQVTIPKVLRDNLGIRAGEILDFKEEDGRLIATKAESQDSVTAVTGVLHSKNASTDSFLEELRGKVLPGEVDEVNSKG